MTTARLKIIGTIVLLLLIASTVLTGTVWGSWFLWQSIVPTPTATAASSPTVTPTVTGTASITPTSTPTPTNTATATHAPSITPSARPTATPTATPTGTSTSTPTSTQPPTPTLTATSAPTPTSERPTPTPTLGLPAPTLLEPIEGAHVDDTQRFTWQWDGPPLEEDQAFDLRIWSVQEEQNDQPRRGAVTPTRDLEVEVDLAYAPAINDYGPGDYYWTVVVVQIDSDEPPQIVGAWGEKRQFTFGGSPRPPHPKPTDPSSKPTPTRIQP